MLNAAIDAIPSLQSDVNALSNLDAAAFEAWAKANDGSDAPAIDAEKHHAANLALVSAQKKAAAATSARSRLEEERTKVHNYGVAAKKAIHPLAAMITMSKMVPELLAEAAELQTQLWHKTAQFDDAYDLLIATAESMQKGSPEAKEIYDLAEKLGTEIRNRTQGRPAMVHEVRAAWLAEINSTIDANTTINEENE